MAAPREQQQRRSAQARREAREGGNVVRGDLRREQRGQALVHERAGHRLVQPDI